MKKRIMSLVMVIIMLFTSAVMAFPASAAESISIVFDANGGVGAPGTVTVSAGSVITLPAQQPKKAGMEFRGWAFNKADADAGYITYSADQSHQVLCNSSATLYASYAYVVTLHPGNRGWGATQKLYKFPSRDLELFHHKADIQPNYGMLPGVQGDVGNLMVFVEWNTAQLPTGRGDGASYHEKYTTNAPTALYAIWGNPVLYSADGGTFPETGNGVAESYVTAYDSTPGLYNAYGNFGMPVGENAPYKAGSRQYTENGGEVYARVFANGSIYRMERSTSGLEIPIFNSNGYSWSDFYCSHTSYGESGMLLHAVWEPSVTYKANGGSGKDVVEYMTYAGGTLYNYNDYTVRANSFTNSSAFTGWNTKPDGTGTSYKAGDVIRDYGKNKPLVLYAQWQTPVSAAGEYRVSFNAMEGYLESDKQSYSVSYGQKLSKAISELPVPTRQGYIFRGWVNDETGSELILDTEYYALDHDTSYSARWELHGYHTLQKYRKPATCSTEGYYTEECKSCGYINTITYEKIAHTYDNWNSLEDGRVAQFCSQCLNANIADTTAMIPQEIIAYNNYAVGAGSEDYAYIDTLNYIGPAIDNGPGSNPFGADYFSNLNGIRNRARAQNPNIKIVLTIFNRNISTFESWLSSGNRASFAQHLVNTVTSYGFDGLDIDYEFPTNAPKSDFVALLAEVRARFNALEAQTGKHYILSIATPASVWSYTKFDLPGCAQYIDYFNIMNYDLYCGSAFPYTHHHTPPYDNMDPYGHILTGGSVQSDITLYKSLGIPADKIVAGSGMYSRRWNGVGSANNGLFQSGSLDESNIHYDVLMSGYVNSGGFTRYWDDVAKAPYLYNPYNQQFISYDDKDSLRHKIDIIQRERIRGLMIFDYVTCDSCGIIPWIGQNIGSAPHACHLADIETKNATCTEDGYVISRCTICNSLGGYTLLPHEGHYAQDWTVKTAATATKAGVLKGTCVHCNGEATRAIEPLGYTVTFDGNGGSVVGSTKLILQANEKYSEKAAHITAVKDGAKFAGWYCEEAGYTLKASDRFTLGKNITFKAEWEGGEVHEHSYKAVTTEATCTEDGVITYTCSCGEAYTETIPALGHSFGDWVEIKAPTTTEVGIETGSCSVCGETETREIPMLSADAPIIAGVDNYTITLNGIVGIKEIRFAIGHYTMGAEVKAAEKNVTMDAATVAKYTVDGVMTYDLPWMGEYTFWVRSNDGSQYFLYTDVNDITPYAESHGVKLTVKDFGENYKDLWIAEGTFNSYAEIKASTAFKYQASAVKLANYFATHDFSYTVTNPGDYTVLIRYNDGSFDVVHTTLTVDVPVFIENGLQVTVTNIPNVKIIRTAYGHYTSVGDIKKAAGVRNFSNKNDIKNAEEYMIQYREEGEVTLIVEFNNGYKHFYYYNVVKKVPTVKQDVGKVVFSDLDGLYIIRYAKGKYTTANNIKNASGSKYLKADAINDKGKIAIKDLSAGRWSFMVQYDDESCSFYLLDIE
ncbi:MAG: InlB B-repeat-containing protein [Clostridia bacterium]|nr:InlB B-repeat-containing protein [Clostridia bacterium]